MITQTADWMTSKDRACIGQAALFQASILDYSPTSEEFADLTPAEHAQMAAEKANVEEKAVDTCFGCPLMMQCEAWSIENRVSGVAGGRTESERDQMRAAAGLDQSDAQAQAAEPALCAADRGKRGKIDDATVARLTASQWSSEDIARHMDCSVRTVTRSRDRIAKAAAKAAAAAAAQAQADTTAVVDQRMAALAIREDAKVATARAAAAGAAFVAYTSGRPVTNIACPTAAKTVTPKRLPSAGRVSAPMKAIYDTLADGQWHTREDLINMAAIFVTDAEALAWWDKNVAAKSKSPATASTSEAKRIADGARDKVSNALSASARNGKHTVRGGPEGTDASLFRLASHAPAELVTA